MYINNIITYTMSTPQVNNNNEFNNKMSQLVETTEYMIGVFLVFSIIILTTLSALFGGVVMQIYYGIEYIFNKTKEYTIKVYNFCELLNNIDDDDAILKKPVKKPIIDECWCNLNVKNIIKNKHDLSQDEEQDEEDEEEEVEEDEDASAAEEQETSATDDDDEEYQDDEDASAAEDEDTSAAEDEDTQEEQEEETSAADVDEDEDAAEEQEETIKAEIGSEVKEETIVKEETKEEETIKAESATKEEVTSATKEV